MNASHENMAPPAASSSRSRVRKIGILLCVAAVLVLGGWAWWAWASPNLSTDNAYVRGDVTSLAPKVAGYVKEVSVSDNQFVRAGDVLFRIDDSDYRARLAQAEANVQAAQARLISVDAESSLQQALIQQARAQHHAQLAERELAAKVSDRRRALVQSRYVSQDQVDESDAARSRADAGVLAASATVDAQSRRISVLATQRQAAEAAVAQAIALRDLARIDLDSTAVLAPIDGRVGNRQVRVGRFVTPGAPLLDIVPTHDLWLVANFKETQLANIRPGQRVRIEIDGYPGTRFEGVVDSFAPGSGASFSLLPVDNATGNFVRVVQRVPVKIRFAGGELPPRLVPGLSARVDVEPWTGS